MSRQLKWGIIVIILIGLMDILAVLVLNDNQEAIAIIISIIIGIIALYKISKWDENKDEIKNRPKFQPKLVRHQFDALGTWPMPYRTLSIINKESRADDIEIKILFNEKPFKKYKVYDKLLTKESLSLDCNDYYLPGDYKFKVNFYSEKKETKYKTIFILKTIDKIGKEGRIIGKELSLSKTQTRIWNKRKGWQKIKN